MAPAGELTTDEWARELVAALHAERMRRGWSQRRLGERLGRHSYSTVHQWERAVNTPGLNNFVAWAAALGYRVELVKRGGG